MECVSQKVKLRELLSLFFEKRCSFLPVKGDSAEILGIINKNMLLKAINQGYSLDNTIKDYKQGNRLRNDFYILDPEQTIEEARNINYAYYLVKDDKDNIIGGFPKRRSNRCWRRKEQIKLNEMRTILDSTTNGIVAIDREGTVSLINSAAKKVLGIEEKKPLKGEYITDLIPNTGLLEVLESGKKEHSQKLMIKGRTLISNRSPVIINGKIIGAVGVFQDISKLESVSKELETTKKLNKELNAIIESSYDGIYVTDGKANTLRVNEAYERISGLDRDDLIGRNMESLEDKGYFSQSVSLLVKRKKEPVTILQNIHNGNEEKIVLVTGNPVFDQDGNMFRILTNVRDLTELNKLKEKLQETQKLNKKYYEELTSLRFKLKKNRKIVAKSEAMKKLLDSARRVSKFDSTILITGESGTGKELISRYIHDNSLRKENSFIEVNCGAIPVELLESEMFGYKQGAFTGANKQGKEGLFKLADGGTLFLDEIGELPLNLQVKLLRAIQEQSILPVGAEEREPVDVRIIAATNCDLEEMVIEGEFREDLYYRLNVVPLYVPALRDRKADIPPLIKLFLQNLNQEYEQEKKISECAFNKLIEYDWYGNVRELKNIIERMFIMSPRDIISDQ
ncbi:MAG: sigma 54-interacting transcriptional regulator, partial [Bacillota bacterium]